MLTKKRKLALAAVAAVLGSAALYAADALPSTKSATQNSNATTSSTVNAKEAAAQSAVNSATLTKDAPVELDMTKVSEAFGHFIGRHLKSPGMEFNLDAVIKGIRDGAAGKPAPMSDKEYEKMMLMVQKNAIEKASKENLKAATDYIQKNANNPGMIELQPNKLYYQIITEGKGEVVAPHATPQINYTGKFIDGTVFGSSEETGPVSIPLDQTVPGFSLGIAGMKEGEKRRLIIHPDLGYGMTGHLPPNSLLIFDIEVVKANTADANDANDSDEDDDDYSPLALAEGQGKINKASSKYFDEDELDEDEDLAENDDLDDEDDFEINSKSKS